MPSSDMDVERPKSRETILTANTDDFIIGDRVWVNGTKPGYIQYLGETRFSPTGDWAGVVLDDMSGKNDGSVAGVRYFQCEAKRGVFARLHKLTRYPLLHVCTTPTLSQTPPPLQRCLTPTRTPSPGGLLREGDRVTVSSPTGPNKTGVLRYLGHTDFAAGEWAGVELDEPMGKNNGTVAGKQYFRCPPNYGLFSPSHKVTKMSGSLDRHRRTAHGLDPEKDSSTNGSTQSLHVEGKGYAEESEKRLRQLLEVAEAERRDLATKLEEERKKVEELEFRIEEECITKDDLETEREKERQKIEELQRRLDQETRNNEMAARGVTPDSILKEETKSLNDEIKGLKDKLRQSEAKIQDLQTVKKRPISPSKRADELTRKEEALLQAQLSLDNKRREVQNLLNRLAEQEKELEKSKSRQTRQLDIIDDLNMKLQKSDSKAVNLAEKVHSVKEKNEDLERRLKSSAEQASRLESEKKKLQSELVSPESTSKEHTLLSSLRDKEKEVCELKRIAEISRTEIDQLKEDKEKQKRDTENKIIKVTEEFREQLRQEKKKSAEMEDRNMSRIRDLERILSSAREDLASARLEAEARLSRQEARLQEAELRTENLDRLRDQISRLQADKDLLRVEKEETWKRLQISEENRCRWESEAHRASEEVNLLKSHVQQLRTEFTNHRDDLVKQLAQTEFDNQVVQDLHRQIEEQRRVVDQMQQQLKWTEGEKNDLQTKLTTHRQDIVQLENGHRHEMETMRRSLAQAEAEKQSVARSLEAAQVLLEERTLQQLQSRSIEQFAGEKVVLENKLLDLRGELATLRNGKSQEDITFEELKKEKEALEQQVNFMNTVIVDMQHKNDDLKSKLEILETEVIFDGNIQMGLPSSRSVSRLFCDICGATHNTEDCTKQFRRTLSYSSQESEF